MKIALVGDVMLGRLVNDALGDVEFTGAGPEYPWGSTLPLLRSADIRIGNLEFVLSDDGTPWPAKVFRFRSDTRNVASLTAAGFTVVSLANNHVLDFGAEALRDMLGTLDRHGILHSGAGVGLEDARRPAICKAQALSVGLLAVTDNEPGWAAEAAAPGVHFVPIDLGDHRAGELLALVRRTRGRVDLLIVSAHWGGNWGFEVPGDHRTFARALIDAGADVVYGHSPHVVRGVEVYRGRPIIYSAGDFVDDYAVDQFARNDQSFVFLLETDAGLPRDLRLYPTVILDFQARLARGSARAIARRMQALCGDLGTPATWSEDEACLTIPLGG
ncbi:CapA family protein [Cryobacterium tagatosivorans]|uniref:CapA family protein n=1 Tax=Cryobacterium tagatosivorans TaxID=1259199 RepID=A0A4R8UH65_9MICO|nr:CapA family protein [Cryobacterium tagatosivorans]TFB55627.1 CapA family protein [Cryobacterium tagatosivorans]